jgi:glycosyltransferase involved in cell wall biosynthesis
MSGAADERRPLVSILAPAYNEAAVLEANLTRVTEFMERLDETYRWELIIVDDGSSDATGEVARAFGAARDNVRVHEHLMNFGLGQALCSGFSHCRGDYIVVIDVDLSYAPEHIGALLTRIEETRADIVIASPYMKGGRTTEVPFLRKQLSRWANRFLALTARGANRSGNLSTLTGMVRAYDARFIRSLNLKSMGMEVNTEIVYKGMILGARMEEVPAHLDWTQQRAQATRTSSKRIRRSILFSLLAGFIIRPVAFFIVPAGLLALISLYPIYWMAYHIVTQYQLVAPQWDSFDFALSDAVARAFGHSPHSFIVAGILVMLSVQLFSLGVVALQMKQYFEELFHFGTRVYSQARELERLRSSD